MSPKTANDVYYCGAGWNRLDLTFLLNLNKVFSIMHQVVVQLYIFGECYLKDQGHFPQV